MNLRCFYCQTPFTLGRAEILAALQQMDSENMNHYDAHCPRCRRANSVSRQRLEMFMPNWRETAAEQTTEMSGPGEAPPAAVEETPPAPSTQTAEESLAPKAHHTRKRAGSGKKAAAKPAAKVTSKAASGKKPATTKARPAAKTAASSKSKKTTAKSKNK